MYPGEAPVPRWIVGVVCSAPWGFCSLGVRFRAGWEGGYVQRVVVHWLVVGDARMHFAGRNALKAVSW